MIIGLNPQDTAKLGLVVKINAGRLLPDSVFRKLDERPAYILKADKEAFRRRELTLTDTLKTDTTSVCSRNSIADITFSDSLNFAKNIKLYNPGTIPFKFSSRSGTEPGEYRPILITDLRDGTVTPRNPFHQDLITVFVILSVWLFMVVRATIRSMRPELIRFFLFRGINEPVSRDTATLFYWQSTAFNFITFVIYGLFLYTAATYYDIPPAGLSPALAIPLLFVIVSAAVTLRHLVCIVAGRLSGQQEVFSEYLIHIYYSYRFCSWALFALVILTFYTVIFTPQVTIKSGFTVITIFYIYRISRLLFIFIKRHMSIFYLILYLCALEILPFLILVKYITGQV